MKNSVEVPSSFLEPSIVFDEKEGRKGLTNTNNVTKYKFNSIFTRQNNRPTILETKISEGTQIKPKDNQSDSLIA